MWTEKTIIDDDEYLCLYLHAQNVFQFPLNIAAFNGQIKAKQQAIGLPVSKRGRY